MMQMIDIQRLRDDTQGVIAAAQSNDVLVVDQGKIVAVVSKPKSLRDADYWTKRKTSLADVVALPGWDSTIAVSEDRDRS